MTNPVDKPINKYSVACETSCSPCSFITGDKNSPSLFPPCANTSGNPTKPPMIDNMARTTNGTVINAGLSCK